QRWGTGIVSQSIPSVIALPQTVANWHRVHRRHGAKDILRGKSHDEFFIFFVTMCEYVAAYFMHTLLNIKMGVSP
ncbi:MAG: hypothetical protein RSD99_33100, partial [Janthinobacterium sp.]